MKDEPSGAPSPGAPPLAGLRVLDLSRILAGPWAAQALGDLGADVLKIERPGTGDDTRHWGPPFVARHGADPSAPPERTAAYFHAANRNKRSVAIDLATPDGAARVRRLAMRADVVIENFRVGGAARLGLDHERLAAGNPRLVTCSITGFGQDGPRAGEPGYDAMIQAASGHMSITGEPDGGPQKIGVALMDIMTGLYAAIAIQAALWRRERTGRGEHIDMALMDVAVGTLANQAMNYLATGEAPGRLGTAHPNIVPYQAFACADGAVMVAVGNDAQFVRLCEALGLGMTAGDGRFATNAGRVENREALIAALGEAFAALPMDRAIALLNQASVPCGPVNTIDRVFADPQVRARGMALDMDGVPGVRMPVRFKEASLSAPRPSPVLGEHGRDVEDDPDWT